MSRSKKLWHLQKIDTAIDNAKKRIAEIDTKLADDQELRMAQEQERKMGRKLEERKKELRKAERDVKDQERKIEQNESKLYGGKVTNPKELEDLQLEAESLQRYLSVLEERQLEAMLEVDQAEKKHKAALAALRDIQDKRKELHADLHQEKAELQNNISALRSEREGVLEGISPEDEEHYQRLRNDLGGIAVAQVKGESCSACGTRVPSATYQKARSPSQLTHCRTCDRILHAD